jgi:hypothetical protein
VPETRFRVASGGCLECGCNVEGKLQSLPGAEDVKILAGADVIMVQHDGRLDADTVRRAAAAHNLTLVGQDEPGVDQDRAWWGDGLVLTIAAAGVLLLVTLACRYVLGSETVATVFGLATVLVGGAHCVREASLGWQDDGADAATLRIRQPCQRGSLQARRCRSLPRDPALPPDPSEGVKRGTW